jgi:hypothetical protein
VPCGIAINKRAGINIADDVASTADKRPFTDPDAIAARAADTKPCEVSDVAPTGHHNARADVTRSANLGLVANDRPVVQDTKITDRDAGIDDDSGSDKHAGTELRIFGDNGRGMDYGHKLEAVVEH